MSSKNDNSSKKSKPRRGVKRPNLAMKQAIAQQKATVNAKANDSSLAATGMHGINPRAQSSVDPNSHVGSLKSPGATDVLQVICPVTQRSISYLAMGIILRALKNGSLAAQSFQQTPYYQWRYLIDVFKSCMSSGTMLLTAAPHWLWEILYALKPKEGSFKTGWVSYAWNIEDDGQGLDQAFALGNGPDAYSIYWGTGASPAIVNGFPALGPTAPVYDPVLGLAAISSLWNYVLAPGEKIVSDPGPSGVLTSQDTSAFAVVYPELGESYFSEGGVRTTIYSERHIDSPALCQFSKYQDAGTTLWRGWHQARVGAGSACSIGPMWMEFNKDRQARNKNTPIYKFYNFDEIFDQLSLTLCYASEKLQVQGLPVLPCPLTAQQAALLLRQSVLQVMNNEFAQDVRYSGSGYVSMIPFTVGPNGSVSGATIPMQIPTFLGENIRAMAKLTTRVSKKFPSSVTWYPVLARPPSKPFPTNYVYGGGVPLYSGNVEAPINLIDVSSVVGPNTYYLDLTRTEMSALVETWNSWITSFTSVLSPLITITSESGLRAINCNTYSNLVEVIAPAPPPPAPGVLAKRNSAIKVFGSVGMSARATETVIVDSYFKNVGERRITSLAGFNKNLDQIIDNFILPVSYSLDNTLSASYQGYQAFMVEPSFKVRSSAGGVGDPANPASAVPNSYDRHIRAAQFDVKAFATTDQQNEVIASFIELAKQGRGGFLTSALAGIANAFLPGAGSLITNLIGE